MEKIATVRGSDSGGKYPAYASGHRPSRPASTGRPKTIVSVEKMPMKILRKLEILDALKVAKAHRSATAPSTAVVASSPVAATTNARMPNSPTPILKDFMGVIRECVAPQRGPRFRYRPQTATGIHRLAVARNVWWQTFGSLRRVDKAAVASP